MSQFFGRYIGLEGPNKDWFNCYSLIQKLSFADQGTIFAECMHARREALYADRTGAKRSGSRPCVKRLLGKRCGQTYGDYHCDTHEPPGSDHASFWTRGRKPYSYVYQPYGIGGETFKELASFCSDLGLLASVDASWSWHYPGATLLVELMTEHSDRVFKDPAFRGAVHDPCIDDFSKRKPIQEVDTLIQLFKNGTAMAIATEAKDEREFLDELSLMLGQAIEEEKYAGEWEHHLSKWLPQAVDICCKLKGYKTESVREKRVLIAGDVEPRPEDLSISIDEKGAVVSPNARIAGG